MLGTNWYMMSNIESQMTFDRVRWKTKKTILRTFGLKGVMMRTNHTEHTGGSGRKPDRQNLELGCSTT
jgi:hypothetical protein